MLNNLEKLGADQPEGRILYLDGTYKLFSYGWALTDGVTFKLSPTGISTHSFVLVLECITII